SKRLADLVRKESCADVAKSLGLIDDVKLGQVGALASARLRKSVLGDICEAVIGAVFLDGGYPAAALFVERHWTERMRKAPRACGGGAGGRGERGRAGRAPPPPPGRGGGRGRRPKRLPTPVYREIER